MTDWVSISALATAGSTILLAGATFTSVRSASRAAAAAERSVLVGMRPVLLSSRLDDRDAKIFWMDEHWAMLPGGHAYVNIVDGNLYMAISVRNAGPGLGVLQGWGAWATRLRSGDEHTPLESIRPQTRDLFIPAGDVGYWHAAIRDTEDPLYSPLCDAVKSRVSFSIEVLYSDHEGGQRSITSRRTIGAAPPEAIHPP
jgi:hypothetical protein